MKYIKPLSQRDPRWKNDLLGFGVETIGQYGCTITCIAMALGETPRDVNEKFKENNVFVGSTKNLVEWTRIESTYPQAKWLGRVDSKTVPAPLDQINDMLSKDFPVIIEVEADEIGTPKGQHFLLIVGKMDNDYVVNDPWTGEQFKLGSRYSNLGSNKPENVILGIRKLAIENKESGNMNSDMDMYLGIDLNNKESVKVAVQTWKDVIDGKYIRDGVSKDSYNTAISERNNARLERDQIKEVVKSLVGEFNSPEEAKKKLTDKLNSMGAVTYQEAREAVIKQEEIWRRSI